MTNIMGMKETILNARKEKGYTQKEMAEKLQISQPAYSYYEKGEKALPILQLKKVLNILDIEINDNFLKHPDPLEKIAFELHRIADALEKLNSRK